MIAHLFMCYDKITTVTDVVFVSRVAPVVLQDWRGYRLKHFGRLYMQSKQEFVLNASKEVLLAMPGTELASYVHMDDLTDQLISIFAKLYDKCEQCKSKKPGRAVKKIKV